MLRLEAEGLVRRVCQLQMGASEGVAVARTRAVSPVNPAFARDLLQAWVAGYQEDAVPATATLLSVLAQVRSCRCPTFQLVGLWS
jgi:hypothetical protein